MYPFFFFFNDSATTEIYTLSLHDALPISQSFTPFEESTDELYDRIFDVNVRGVVNGCRAVIPHMKQRGGGVILKDRKSTRLNSSHMSISYAVFCLKKKKKHKTMRHYTTMT